MKANDDDDAVGVDEGVRVVGGNMNEDGVDNDEDEGIDNERKSNDDADAAKADSKSGVEFDGKNNGLEAGCPANRLYEPDNDDDDEAVDACIDSNANP